MNRKRQTMARKAVALFVVVWFSLSNPVISFAQAVDATGNPTGAPADTGAPACTGASCDQGAGQGLDQGSQQGFNQGSQQGVGQGANTTVSASNSGTGAGSTNQAGVTTANNSTNSTQNTAQDTTNATGVGTTGGNASNMNTGNAGVGTGNAGIGVTQVKNDNSTVVGGSAGLSVQGTNGDYNGDLNLSTGSSTADLSHGQSVQATNQTTGSDSTNTAGVTTTNQQLTEVQNDGKINNLVDLAAITGQNTADKNTGDATIKTGNADVAATLVNLLNTSVVNGNLWVSVADIFGNLNGNIIVPELAQLGTTSTGNTAINAGNNQTGNDSTNTVNVGLNDANTTRVANDATINTTVNASAITGQNEAVANTGGGAITTGDGSAQASSVSLANTTIEGGNWALVIISALNGWFGFLVGDAGQVKALSQEETLHQIDAQNNKTGNDSTNSINVTDTNTNTTTVANNAEINNTVNASAITGQNEASKNTGQGTITTGNASVSANAVNIANTTVKNGSLLVAVVNIFGDWFGDLLYKGNSLLAAAAAQGPTVAIDAANTSTGANSDNTINADINHQHTTNIDNKARVTTTLNATVDTGSNKTNRNTLGGNISTGNGVLALHSRAVANTTGVAVDPALNLEVQGLNDTTGFNSQNKINAKINDQQVIDINNDANISTIIGALANTGNNEANQNTLGGSITTGTLTADVAIQNLVNQIMLALGGSGVDPETLTNRLTGAFSENSNDVQYTYNRLIDILNRGLVNNLVNLILNTGGNIANENTVGGHISTGTICVTGTVANTVNSYSSGGVSGNLQLTQDGHVTTNANTHATTGNNTADRNTAPQDGSSAGDCPTLAEAPTPTPVPQGSTQQANNGTGGGEVEEQKAPRVAGVTHHENEKLSMIGGGKLTRFPVAGGENLAQLLQGRDRINWPLFIMASVLLIGVAWRMDRQKKLLPVRVNL